MTQQPEHQPNNLNQPGYPQQQGPPEQKSGGCLKGCIITGVSLLVLTVVIVTVGYFAGRAYFQRQLPIWQEEYPMLGLAVDLLDLRESSQSSRDRDELLDELSFGADRQPGTDEKALLPADLHLYPNPLTESFSISDQQGIGYQQHTAAVTDVADYLEDMMASAGWQLENKDDASDALFFAWRKDDLICIMEIIEFDGYTEIWLRYGIQ